MEEQGKKLKITTVIYAVAVFTGACLIITGILIYGFDINNQFIRYAEKIVPYPAAVVGTAGFVSTIDLENNLQAVKRFYENQNFSDAGLRVDFSTDNGKKRLLVKRKEILNKLIENKVIEKLADERGISITDGAVAQAVDQQITRYGNKNEVLNNLQKLYGWNLDDFRKKLVKPDLYQAALEKNIAENDPEVAKSRQKAQAALDSLNNRMDFAEAVKKYSEGDSAKNGGDLGWFGASQMLPQLASAAFNLARNETSGIIESPLGFHILALDDKKSENGEDKVKIRQIFVKKQVFGDWLLIQEKSIKISIPLKGFFWNKENGEVEFADSTMREFEKELQINSAGDASVMF